MRLWRRSTAAPRPWLEVTRAMWATETDMAEAFVVLTRRSLVLVHERKRGLFRPPGMSVRTLPLADYSDLGDLEIEELTGPAVMFLAPDERDHFALGWHDASERNRMFRSMFDAHRERYARWGLQLDPSNYPADFERYHA